MTRALIIVALAFGCLTPGAHAQDGSTPIVRTELQAAEAIAGQPIILRITVLAPTFLPSPPVFPTMEVPNLMVRLPERASGPASEKVGSETWSGVTRAYRLYPLIPGEFRIGPRPVEVTYADPDTSQPVRVSLSTKAVTFTGVVPEGAEDLDPFVAASNLSLEQSIDGDPASMAAGDALLRTITSKIDGTSPMFLPDLILPLNVDGLSEYRKEPLISETMDRGTLSGTRTESVTYIAEAGGTFSVPALELEWFDLDGEAINIARVDGFDMSVSGPPPTARDERSWQVILRWGLPAIALLALLLSVYFWIAPAIWAWRKRRHDAWLASEAYAYERALAALRAHDLDGATRALEQWKKRVSPGAGMTYSGLDEALVQLGAGLFGHDGGMAPKQDWVRASQTVTNVRAKALKASKNKPSMRPLPPLNPKQPA